MPSTIPLEQIWGEGRGAGKEGGRGGKGKEGGRKGRKRKSKCIKVVMPVNSKEGGRERKERRDSQTKREEPVRIDKEREADVQVIWTVLRLCQSLP